MSNDAENRHSSSRDALSTHDGQGLGALESRWRRAVSGFLRGEPTDDALRPRLHAVTSLQHELTSSLVSGIGATHGRVDVRRSAMEILVGGQWRLASRQKPSVLLELIWFFKALGRFPLGPLEGPLSAGFAVSSESRRGFRMHVGRGERPLAVVSPCATEEAVDDADALFVEEHELFPLLERARTAADWPTERELLHEALDRADAEGGSIAELVLTRLGESAPDHAEASRYHRRALHRLESRYGPDHVALVPTLTGLAERALELQRHRDAAAGFKRVISILERAYGDADLELVRSYEGLWRCEIAQNGTAEAQRWRARGEALLIRFIPPRRT